MHEGLHVILVGTTDAVRDVVNTHLQVRNVFRAPLTLEPLSLSEVHELLRIRYDRWRHRPDEPVAAPVEDRAVDLQFGAFQGDLRGLLKALDDGVEACIGLGAELPVPAPPCPDPSAPERNTAERTAVPPVRAAELSRALQARYGAMMRSELDEARATQIVRWIEADVLSARTQKELIRLWGLSQGTVSSALRSLVAAGCVLEHSREGKQAIRYTLSGKARLMAGLV